MGMMSLFKVIILVQLFFSVGLTMYIYAMPTGADSEVGMLQGSTNIDLESTSEDIQDSLERQTNIPVIDIGALVFYSGNIILDMVLNFMFAIPEMLTLLIGGIMRLINLDSFLMTQIQLFITVIISAMYMLGAIQFIASIRSGRDIA